MLVIWEKSKTKVPRVRLTNEYIQYVKTLCTHMWVWFELNHKCDVIHLWINVITISMIMIHWVRVWKYVKVFDLFMLYEFRLSVIRMLNVHYVLVYIRPNGNIPRKWPLEKLNDWSIIEFICLHCLKLTKLMKAYSVCYVSLFYRLLTPVTCSGGIVSNSSHYLSFWYYYVLELVWHV